jgi:hypothetical protein
MFDSSSVAGRWVTKVGPQPSAITEISQLAEFQGDKGFAG